MNSYEHETEMMNLADEIISVCRENFFLKRTTPETAADEVSWLKTFISDIRSRDGRADEEIITLMKYLKEKKEIERQILINHRKLLLRDMLREKASAAGACG